MVTKCKYVTQFRIKVDKIRRLFDTPFGFKSAPEYKRAARFCANSNTGRFRGNDGPFAEFPAISKVDSKFVEVTAGNLQSKDEASGS